jgi:hypothetical protein
MTHLTSRGKLCGRPDGHNGGHRSAESLERERQRKPESTGIRAHPLYGILAQMIQRCENPGHWAYKYYGGRGIKVCDRWHDFRLFLEDVERDIGQRPDGMTLDRTNTDGDYEPGNVRWATMSEQRCNRRDFDADRVRAVISRYRSGETRASIARALDLKYDAVKAIVLRWHDGGYQPLGITT